MLMQFSPPLFKEDCGMWGRQSWMEQWFFGRKKAIEEAVGMKAKPCQMAGWPTVCGEEIATGAYLNGIKVRTYIK